jgi:ATP-dependent Lon protease
MEKSQREYYLNEQVKAIQKELGEMDEGADLDEVEKRIKAAHMPKEARKKAEAEFKKLRLMSPMSAEATVVRNYIDTLVNLPWKKRSKISRDIAAAEKILDADHYGLEKVKERIVEYLAVQIRVDKVKAPILCLVGAPGVGKTSLGQSLARRPTASSCACRSAACATRPRSAATGAPTSARCPARSCRT